MYYIAVFRVRGQSLRLLRELENSNIPASIINTPGSLNVGCGLSVRFESAYLQRVVRILNGGNYYSLYGIFYVKKSGGQRGGMIKIL